MSTFYYVDRMKISLRIEATLYVWWRLVCLFVGNAKITESYLKGKVYLRLLKQRVKQQKSKLMWKKVSNSKLSENKGKILTVSKLLDEYPWKKNKINGL